MPIFRSTKVGLRLRSIEPAKFWGCITTTFGLGNRNDVVGEPLRWGWSTPSLRRII